MPYYEAQLYLESIFNLERLYYLNLIFDLPMYMQNYFISVIITWDKEYCMGRGLENDQIEYSLSMEQKFMDCYKKLIDRLFDRSTTFSGYEAKYFDKCQKSEGAFVEMKTWDYKEPTKDEVSSGTVNPESLTFCKPLPLFGGTNGGSARRALLDHSFDRVADYLFEKFKPEDE